MVNYRCVVVILVVVVIIRYLSQYYTVLVAKAHFFRRNAMPWGRNIECKLGSTGFLSAPCYEGVTRGKIVAIDLYGYMSDWQ